MFKVPPFATRANWVYENTPWRDVIQMTFKSPIADGKHITVRDTPAIHFGNVSYVGLDTDERLKNAAMEAIGRYGVQFSSSRAYVQLPYYEELESLLELMFGRPCMATPTTTLAHQAAMPLFMQPEDAVLVDYQAHASLQMNLEIVRARGTHVEAIAHNNLNVLEERIQALSAKHERIWYVADGVYSMFGDTGPMAELPALLDRYEQLHVYLDDAHGMSWTGKHGTGLVCEKMPLHERVLLVTSLNKGFASGGGCIVCPDRDVWNWLKRCGSSLVFSGPLQPGQLAAGVASAKIHCSPEITERQQRVRSNIRYFLEYATKYNVLLANYSETPIFFAAVGKTHTGVALCKKLREAGFYTNLGIFPAVPLNQTGLRISVHYHLEKENIDHLLRLLAEYLPQIMLETNTKKENTERAFSRRQR